MALEFSAGQAEINGVLSIIAHALAAKPIKPIYSGVLIRADGNQLVFTATDGGLSIRAGISADITMGGAAVFPARLLTELVRKQTGERVSVSVDDKGMARIVSSGSRSSVVCMDASDFPDVVDVENGSAVRLKAGSFKNAVSRAIFAVSTDETRKVLTGVRMEAGSAVTKLITIDGFKLALRNIEADNAVPAGKECVAATIPGYVMSRIAKLVPDDETDVTLTVSPSHCMASFGGVTVYTTLLTGEFIEYKNLIGSASKSEILIDQDALFAAIDRCSLMARESKSNLITMDIGQDVMTMRSRAENGDVSEEIPITLQGEPVKISFNAQYLADAVRNAETDRIRMYFNGPVSPCLVRPDEGDAFTYLVLPVRTYQ